MNSKPKAATTTAIDDTQHTGSQIVYGVKLRMKPNCSQIGDIDLPGKNRSWHDISWHDCTGFWWFLRTSTWSGSNIRYRRKAMRAVSWHQHFTVMTSAIQHASKNRRPLALHHLWWIWRRAPSKVSKKTQVTLSAFTHQLHRAGVQRRGWFADDFDTCRKRKRKHTCMWLEWICSLQWTNELYIWQRHSCVPKFASAV